MREGKSGLGGAGVNRGHALGRMANITEYMGLGKWSCFFAAGKAKPETPV